MDMLVLMQYFKDNPDSKNPAYSTKLGIYKENCGLDNVTLSWGHDEYMYMVCFNPYPKTHQNENMVIFVLLNLFLCNFF